MILRIPLPADSAALQQLKYHRNADGSHSIWCEIDNFALHTALDSRQVLLDVRVSSPEESLEESQEDR